MSNLDNQAIVGTERRWYLLLSNPSKTTHLGTLIRCAAAFRAHQLLLVGHDKFNCQGSFGSHLFLDIVAFPSWDGVWEYLGLGGDDNIYGNDDRGHDVNDSTSLCESSRQRDPIDVVGILGAYGGGDEIYSPDGMAVYEGADSFASLIPPDHADEERGDMTTCRLPRRSYPVHTRPFTSDVCFLLSRDTRGLPISQARLCTRFVHVPHLSFDDSILLPIDRPPPPQSNSSDDSMSTNSPTNDPPITTTRITQSTLLDTATTLSIVLHHFTAWAGYSERTFDENQKFVKDSKPNARRRLCRVVNECNKEQDRGGDDDKDVMDSTTLWNETCGELQGGDY